MSIELTIVILSFNTKDLLLKCLASVSKNPNWKIIVVDNGSADDSLSEIRKHFPKIEIIENHKNLGFAAGNNIVLKKVTSPFTLLLNPDTIILGKAIETTLNFVKANPKVGAATCRVELSNGELDYSCHRGFPSPINSLLHFFRFKNKSSYSNKNIPNINHEIDSLTGAFALIRTSAGKQAGWLDEDYFWNGEDLDFCFKLKKLGWKIFYLPQEKIIHYKGSSSQANRDRRLEWAKNSTVVMWLFYKKNLSSNYSVFVNILVWLGIKCLLIIRVLKNLI